MPDFSGLEESFEGEFGWAKRISDITDHPNASESISDWLIFAPHAHPMWQYHYMYTIRLREIPGREPLQLAFPEANHEIGVLALQPEYQPYSVEQLENMIRTERLEDKIRTKRSFPILMPPDAVVQLQCTDDEALKLSAGAAFGVCYGLLIPDSDGASAWAPILQKTLQHLRTGGHTYDPRHGRY
jgi:hypothetical protein